MGAHRSFTEDPVKNHFYKAFTAIEPERARATQGKNDNELITS